MATVDTSPSDTDSNPYIASLIYGNRWSGTVTYSFGVTSGQTWTSTEMQAFRNAFAAWSAVCNITFAQNTSGTANFTEYEATSATWDDPPGRITLADHHIVGTGNGSDGGQTEGRYNTNHSSWSDLAVGGMGYSTIVHELGHAIGLDHPHDAAELFPGVERGNAFGDLGDNNQNQAIWTIMSYNRGWNGQPATSNAFGHAGGPMAFDIAAVQRLYGANMTTRTGSDTYALPQANGSGTFWSCIWDAGGNDTISNANGTTASTINLQAAPLTGANAGGYVSWVGGIAGGFTIANGVVIENAIGGKAGDTITGNDAANVLEGGAGGDVIDGKLGNDTASYANSLDGVVIDLRRASLETTNSNYLAPAGGDAAGDTLISIENLIGSRKNDVLHGRDATGSTIDGGAGDDTLFGYLGNDVIRGGMGADTIKDTGGNDVIYGGDSNFIRNGSFEVVASPTFDANGYGYNEPIDGWTLLSGSRLELFKAGSIAGAPSDGKYGVDLEGNQANTNVAISQVVSGLADGQLYRIAFDVRRVAGADAKFEVYWGGTKVDLTTAGAKEIVPSTDGTTYYIGVFGGVGTGSDKNRLTFREIGGGDAHGTLLDNVRMYRDAGGTNPAANAYDPFIDGNDTITVGTGSDTVHGHGGDDTVTFSDIGPGTDQFDGGSGNDLLVMDWSNSTTQIIYRGVATSGTPQLSPDIGQAESYTRSGAAFGEADQKLFFNQVERFNLKGGTGNDTLKGGEFNDILIGNRGDDTLNGGGGVDDINGGEGFDRAVIVLSGSGANTLVLKQMQSGGSVTLSNGTKLTSIEAIDLEAGEGDDFLDVRGTVVNPAGLASTDPSFKSTSTNFSGKGGNDTLAVDLATSDSVKFDGGAGSGDLFIMDWSAATRDIFRDTGDGAYRSYQKTINVVTGGQTYTTEYYYTASFTGVERFNLTGGSGNDVLYGGSGNDRLNGFTGRDTLAFGAGSDTLVLDWTGYSYGVGGGVNGSLAAGYDGSYSTGYSSTYAVSFTGAEQFDLTLTENGDSVVTGDGNDIVRGNGGNDTLNTAKGIDIVNGGAGTADRWIADKSAMTATQTMVLDLTRSGTQATYLGTGTVTGIEALTLTTGAGADIITTLAGDLNDTVKTMGGADVVKLAGGRDVVDLGAGSDTLVIDWSGYGYQVGTGVTGGSLTAGYSGNFQTGYSSTYYAEFAGVEQFDLTLGDATGGDNVTTGDGNDIVRGMAGNDTLNTAKGIDKVYGGDGIDRWVADQSAMTTAQAMVLDLTLAGTQAAYRGTGIVADVEATDLITGAGADRIVTRFSDLNDTVTTGIGNDRVTVAGGRDTVNAGADTDTLVLDWTGYGYNVSGGVGTGSLEGGYDGNLNTGYSSTYAVTFTGVEHFILTLGDATGGDTVATGDGDDTVKGMAGNDTLNTAKGIDIVDGGAGTADRWIADKSAMAATQAMVLDLTRSGTQATYLGTGTVTGIEALTLTTGAGADIITTLAGDLNDTLTTGAGNDRVKVAGGRDAASMGTGSDTLVLDWTDYAYGVYVGVEAGTLAGGYDGNFNTGYSSTYAVTFTGVEHFDLILSGQADSVRTGDGNDAIKAGVGNDTLRTGKGIDTVDGGSQANGDRGIDIWSADKSAATVGMTIDLTALVSTYVIDGVTATARNIEALGLDDEAGWPTNRFLSGSGSDTIVTRGEFYRDVIGTGAGNDRVTVAGGRDDIAMGEGTDTLVLDWTGYAYGVGGGVATGSLTGGYDGNFNTGYSSTNRVDFTGTEHFDLTLTENGDSVATGHGNDIVRGNGGNDTLDTAKGIDIVDGGAGTADRWIADKSAMTATQAMVLDLTRSGTQATYLGTGTVTGIEALTLTTGAGADIITTLAGDLNDTLTTGAGNDRVKVAGGRDAASMGTGSDTLVLDWTGYGYGVSSGVEAGTIAGGYDGNFNTGYSSTNRVDFTGTEHFDLTLTENGDSVATGDGNDIVRGNGGNDTLNTAKGIDIVDGGAGTADRWIADKSAMTATQAMVLDLTRSGTQATYLGTGTVTGIESLTLTTGAGADIITTLAGDLNDTLTTGAGNDRVKVAGGRDAASMGTGSDTLVLDWTGYGYGVSSGVEAGTIATGHDGNFNTGYSSTYAVTFTGVEHFDLILTGNVDSVRTGDGNDILNGGGGADTLVGAGGNDTYVVDVQGDRPIESAAGGTDTVKASVSYILETGQELEILTTTNDAGKDAINLTGNERVNTLRGNAGANTLDGGLGADTMAGLAGSDTYLVDVTGDKVYEAAAGGTDTVKVAATAVSYALLAGQEVEALVAADAAGTAALNLTGNGFGQTITGNAGANLLRGGGGNDVINGGGGTDTVDYRDKTVAVEVALNGSTAVNVTVGGVVEDKIVNVERVIGGTAADKLTGNGLANVLDGWTGADTLTGGGGGDTYFVDNLADKVIEAVGGGLDTVKASVSYILAAGQEVETLVAADAAGTAALNLTGNEFAQTMTGNAGANLLRGGGGNDVINGGGGIDTVDYRDKTVAVELALKGSTTVGVAVGGVAEDKIVNVENVTGGAAADKLTGDGLANILDGWTGADTLTGGGGGDTYFVDNLADKVIEAAGGGIDTVLARSTYGLAENQEIEILATAAPTSTATLNLTGNAFAQAITGNAGVNILTGGGGVDRLTGGLGQDTFDFNAKTDSGATSTTRDVVLDFTQGEDRIDLSTIDANGALAGDAFEFLANAGSAFTGKAGQLAFVIVDATGTASDRTVIQADMDGNKVADFQIELKGLYTLTSADFVL